MRKFNVTGLCVPKKHYMVDISGKINQILKLIDDEHYFTINRARQYGKTTMLNELKKTLSQDSDCICASISFESVNPDDFDTQSAFCKMFLQKISRAMKLSNAEKSYAEQWFNPDVSNLDQLSEHITELCKGKKIILMIDEVDKSTNNRMFLHFLGMLRAKYLERQAEADYTFHSVILAGVTDIKNLKLKMINDGIHMPTAEEGRIYNSPWNIAASFNVDMSFNSEEISTMLTEYEADHNTGMDITAISDEIHEYTSGYPFLVSRICQCIDEQLDKDWTTFGVRRAVRMITLERNTLFDDLSKNMANYKSLPELLYPILMKGRKRGYVIYDDDVNLADTFGYIKNVDSKVAVSNKIFQFLLCDYFVSKDEKALNLQPPVGHGLYSEVTAGGVFNMELCLLKFAEYYKELFADRNISFLEEHGEVVFLSYLNPLVNGNGFYHIESRLMDSRRIDIVVDYGKDQFIMEFKIWRGEAARDKAYDQLLGYMETKRASTGYLVTFDLRKDQNKERKAEWVELGNKKIFDVVV